MSNPTRPLWLILTHNPENVAGEHIGVQDGYRLLLPEEIGAKNYQTEHIESHACLDDWYHSAYYGADTLQTYRTLLSVSELFLLP